MTGLPNSITIATALLAAFLVVLAGLKYGIRSNFVRTRILMTALFLFIVITLSISFWPSAALSLPYTVPALAVGIIVGYVIGVKTERQKMMTHGLEHYLEHFAHIHAADIRNMTWWSVVNFYSIMCGLILINLVGFSTVIVRNSVFWTILTSTVGAFLIGTIIPYLAHLWGVPAHGSANR